MAKTVTQAMVDAVIESCIAQTKKGGDFEETTANLRTVGRIVKARGAKDYSPVFPTALRFGSNRPEYFLLDFYNLGLVSKPKHRQFIARAMPVIRTERSCQIVKKIYEHFYKKDIMFGYEGLPFKQKEAAMRHIFGVDFTALEKHYFEQLELDDRLSRLESEPHNQLEEKKLNEKLAENRRKRTVALNKVTSEIRAQLERKRPGTELRPRLLAEMKNEQGYLSNKDLDLLWSSLEEFEHPRPKKPKPMRPSRSAMRRSQQRRILKKWQPQGRRPR